MVKVNRLLPKKGFTLIELLVVIAIIGILATFIVASFSSAQQRARDARRKSDLDAVKKALELAKNDCTGARWYPVVIGASGDVRYTNLAAVLQNATNNYIKSAPIDPTRTGAPGYQYTTGGTPSTGPVCFDASGARNLPGMPRYLLRAQLENTNDSTAAETVTRCATSGAVAGVPPIIYYYVCEN